MCLPSSCAPRGLPAYSKQKDSKKHAPKEHKKHTSECKSSNNVPSVAIGRALRSGTGQSQPCCYVRQGDVILFRNRIIGSSSPASSIWCATRTAVRVLQIADLAHSGLPSKPVHSVTAGKKGSQKRLRDCCWPFVLVSFFGSDPYDMKLIGNTYIRTPSFRYKLLYFKPLSNTTKRFTTVPQYDTCVKRLCVCVGLP